MKIGVDARLISQTGVGRYIRNLKINLLSLDKKNHYEFFQPKIKWHSLAEQLFFPFWLLFKNYDLVHFTYFSFPILCPKKFIVTIHDLIPWHFKTGLATRLPPIIYQLKYFFYKLVLWIGVRRAVKIIAVSQVTKKEIIDHLKIEPKKIAVIYEGVEKNFQSFDKLRIDLLESERPRSRRPEQSRMGQFSIFNNQVKFKNYFLYVGNAYPHKNLKNLIQAFKEIENYQLVLVGPDDDFYRRLREKAKRDKRDKRDKGGERIIFYGPASDEELAGLYRQAAAFINPSLMEGFGLPGLEAMMAGCPVICSDIPAFREIYGEAAIYFKVGRIGEIRDIGDIRETIKRFLAMPKKEEQRLIELGKKQVNKYSWEQCARRTLEVYESCIGL